MLCHGFAPCDLPDIIVGSKFTTTDVLSPYIYFDVETTERIADLTQVINEYANTEFAKFVTGKRPLSELDAYFNEIERIGALELIQIYKDYYGR